MLQEFRGIVYSADKMPKIVEKIKEVFVEVEKTRPILVPVFNSEQEVALELIIHDLISGISKFKREDIQKNFDQGILDLFNIEFESGDSGFRKEARDESGDKEYVRSWIKGYNNEVPETSPLVHLSDKFQRYYKSYSSRGTNFSDLVASFESHYLRENVSLNEEKRIMLQQKTVIETLEKQLININKQNMSLQYMKDKLSGDLQGVMKKVQESIPQEHYESIVF